MNSPALTLSNFALTLALGTLAISCVLDNCPSNEVIKISLVVITSICIGLSLALNGIKRHCSLRRILLGFNLFFPGFILWTNMHWCVFTLDYDKIGHEYMLLSNPYKFVQVASTNLNALFLWGLCTSILCAISSLCLTLWYIGKDISGWQHSSNIPSGAEQVVDGKPPEAPQLPH